MTINSTELARLAAELLDVERLLKCEGKLSLSMRTNDDPDADPFGFSRGDVQVDIHISHPMYEVVRGLLRERALVLEGEIRALVDKGDT